MNRKLYIIFVVVLVLLFGCNKDNNKNMQNKNDKWLEDADLVGEDSKEELYKEALKEETLEIYSASSRTFEAKKSFEMEYPGLTVEIKDIKGKDIVNMLKNNYVNKEYMCDLVICSDCDGSLYKELIEPGIIYSYIPQDIKQNMKDGHADNELLFLGETIMLFYNSEIFSDVPIENIWELTEEKYKKKIIMANPLSSFSTYGFCAEIIHKSDELAKAYKLYYGKELVINENKTVGEYFWERVSKNIVFTNSSDEVLEGIGNSRNDGFMIGIMISSKLRYKQLGYNFEPIYNLEPFAAVYTPNCVSIAAGSKNINSAKLFIRYILGETDGTSDGLKPYSTVGTWSTRVDVLDGNSVPLSDISYVNIDKDYLYDNRENILTFWNKILKENVKK